MFEDLLGAYSSRLVIAVLGVGVALLLLVAALWMIRGRNGPSPFVRGGKNRQPRLQVLDAAAVDTRRRLVLVRRDNVEHLIMIGGPTDIVIESGISPVAPGAAVAIPSAPSALDRPVPRESAVAVAPAAEPRAAAIQRPAAPEPRIEPARENPVAREALRPAPAVTPSAPAQVSGQVPAGATAPPRPASPVAVAAAAEPPVRQAPDVKPEPLRPIAALAAAATAAHSLDNAANVLDAARGRVLQDAPEPRVVPVNAAAVNPATAPPALQPAAEKPKQLGGDFERILEQEMASNLAARETAALPQPNRQLPPRDPTVPAVTGASPEPSLQAEVARIFGEMSVSRDK
ncbi:flagellar biosynthesis protein FliO [Rhizobium puerariae]|uniref:Flagellar biosynthesis protein FliO n=1 Tax=Rhizobium puerariae TaxID=1585791 RepID=A0ABV6AR43_9HYPH